MIAELDLIPLVEAYLCQDCQCVGRSAMQCLCGSTALLCLSTVLNRNPEDKTEAM